MTCRSLAAELEVILKKQFKVLLESISDKIESSSQDFPKVFYNANKNNTNSIKDEENCLN